MTEKEPEAANVPAIYSAPRRFDMATVLVVTTAFSIFFALLHSLGVPMVAVAMVSAFLTLVAIGQAILFGGKKPRGASLLVGAVCWVVIVLAIRAMNDSFWYLEEFLLLVVVNTCVGLIAGYIAGVLIGSVFMVAEAVRKYVGSTSNG